MKVQLERISTDANSSFRIMVNPNLSDFFFWHFHPELELVFIDGTDGTRHVGEHLSFFHQRDLVFIGSNIPHLNFDYGVKGPYQKMVIHIRPDFLEQAFDTTPELKGVERLLERARYGISFGDQTMDRIGARLKHVHLLTEFQQFVELITLFQILSEAPDQLLLHASPVQNTHGQRDKQRLNSIYKFVDENYQRKIELHELAELTNLTKEAFCRYFKKITKLTFTEFVNHYRIDVSKKLLLQGNQITDVCFECGFDSISYFNRVFKKVTGTNPMSFKKEYLAHI